MNKESIFQATSPTGLLSYSYVYSATHPHCLPHTLKYLYHYMFFYCNISLRDFFEPNFNYQMWIKRGWGKYYI